MERNNNGARPTLTPEQRALRAKKLKRKRAIRLAIVVGGFILALAILISPLILLTAFKVKSFEVEGTGSYAHDEIIAASGIELGKSLLFADLDEASENIEKALPYTDNVKLTKKLPNKIIIRFEETSRAFAIEVSSGMYALTNADFKVLEITPRSSSVRLPLNATLVRLLSLFRTMNPIFRLNLLRRLRRL